VSCPLFLPLQSLISGFPRQLRGSFRGPSFAEFALPVMNILVLTNGIFISSYHVSLNDALAQQILRWDNSKYSYSSYCVILTLSDVIDSSEFIPVRVNYYDTGRPSFFTIRSCAEPRQQVFKFRWKFWVVCIPLDSLSRRTDISTTQKCCADFVARLLAW
jgi:hypothetical protein